MNGSERAAPAAHIRKLKTGNEQFHIITTILVSIGMVVLFFLIGLYYGGKTGR